MAVEELEAGFQMNVHTSLLRGYLAYLGTAGLGMLFVLAVGQLNQLVQSLEEGHAFKVLMTSYVVAATIPAIVMWFMKVRVQSRRALVASAREEVGELKGIRLLIVDDEADQLHIFASVLKHAGAAVVTASSIDGAIEQLEGELPDVVLSDLAMPGNLHLMSAKLRIREAEARKRIPVIAVSAYIEAFGRNRIEELGFSGFVAKPVRLQALVEEIQKQLGVKRSTT